MDGGRVGVMVVLLAWIGTGVALGKIYRLEANGDQFEFTEAPERGYVVKLAEQAGGITALSGIAALAGQDATPVRGLGRRGVWIVEKEASLDRGRERVQALGTDRQVAYAAPLFSSYGETVAVLPIDRPRKAQ